MMKTIMIATNNQHKIEEISAILSDLSIHLVTPAQLGLNLEIEESGDTYLENALLKAKAFHQASALPVLADDSGLEVDLLDRQPGIHSHRFLPDPKASSRDRCVYLLSKLREFPKPWKASFHCCAVFYQDVQTFDYSNGKVEGEIIEVFRGDNGFGYDPIFWIANKNKTMAELDSRIKNQISHRALALQGLTALKNWARRDQT